MQKSLNMWTKDELQILKRITQTKSTKEKLILKDKLGVDHSPEEIEQEIKAIRRNTQRIRKRLNTGSVVSSYQDMTIYPYLNLYLCVIGQAAADYQVCMELEETEDDDEWQEELERRKADLNNFFSQFQIGQYIVKQMQELG